MAHPRQALRNSDPRDNPDLNRTYLSLPEIQPAPPPGLAPVHGAATLQPAHAALGHNPALSLEPRLCGPHAHGREGPQ